MKCNVGKTERIARIIAGIVILGLGVWFQSWWGAIGLVPLITGLVRWCPAYGLFGLNTAKGEEGPS
ncbi:MAG: DUF2892 domain-containing protein [Gammaproteobacteria bacterium]|nr:MAG: DUF2892 domain-containing protein [Gammaproteobacteria bacterium]